MSNSILGFHYGKSTYNAIDCRYVVPLYHLIEALHEMEIDRQVFHPRLPNGATVRISKIPTDPELNGTVGTIMEFEDKTQLYTVQLPSKAEIRVKKDHLLVVKPIEVTLYDLGRHVSISVSRSKMYACETTPGSAKGILSLLISSLALQPYGKLLCIGWHAACYESYTQPTHPHPTSPRACS
jgi:hypothetical protein